MFFKNRIDAGKKIVEMFYKNGFNPKGYELIGLARGGVITAVPIAEEFNLPLHAVCEDSVFDKQQKITLHMTSLGVGHLITREKRLVTAESIPNNPVFLGLLEELRRRHLLYNGKNFQLPSQAIVVDDGLVSGKSALVVIDSLRFLGVKDIVLTVPIVPPWITKRKLDFKLIFWRVTRLDVPTTGIFYFEFEDVPDKEVTEAVASHQRQ